MLAQWILKVKGSFGRVGDREKSGVERGKDRRGREELGAEREESEKAMSGMVISVFVG